MFYLGKFRPENEDLFLYNIHVYENRTVPKYSGLQNRPTPRTICMLSGVTCVARTLQGHLSIRTALKYMYTTVYQYPHF